MADWAKMVENRDAMIERLRDENQTRAEAYEELAETTGDLRAENERLRGEAQANYDEGKALAGVLDREIARLREELEENTGVLRALRRQRDESEATIDRVETVLRNYCESIDYDSYLAVDIRAALAGDN